jgi:ATPase subunit of ABC transporter with duplicated ATPase domains
MILVETMDLSVQHIKKSFGIYHILSDVSFLINQGDKVGIVGANGSGKTTLFKILAGIESLDAGDIARRKGVKLSYLDQIPEYQSTVQDALLEAFTSLLEKKTALEECAASLDSNSTHQQIKKYGALQEEFERLGGYDMDTRLQRIIKGLKIDDAWLPRPFSSLSGGEKSRVVLAKLLLEEPDVLLLDEPTNHLDLQSIEWLEQYLSKIKSTVMVISHDRVLLDHFAQKIINIEQGKARVYYGNYTTFIQQKALYMESLWNEYLAQNRVIKRMEEQIERYRIWGRMRDSEKMYKRAKELEHRLERVERLDKPFEQQSIKLRLDSTHRTGKDVIKLEKLSKSYEENILSEVDAEIYFKDRVFIVGNNGAGKTTLFRCIIGEESFEGTIRLGSKVKLGTLNQEIIYSNSYQRVVDQFREQVPCSEGEARNKLAQFLFFGDDVYKQVSALSGGEKSRLELSILVNSDSNVLLLDEPTNHLDIESKELLETALLDYEGTLVIISHDRYFINKIADYIYILENKKLQYFNGNYEEYSKKQIVDESPKEKKQPKKVSEKKTKEKTIAINYVELIEEVDNKIIDELNELSPDYNKIGQWIKEKECLEEAWLESMK